MMPRTRGDCREVPRPCPHISCRWNLYLDVVARTGGLKLNFPDLEPDEMTDSCALDVADRGGATLEEVGALLNMTRERARQIVDGALRKVRHALAAIEASGEGDESGELPRLTGDQERELGSAFVDSADLAGYVDIFSVPSSGEAA